MFKLPPYYENFGKWAIKSPKYFFTDTGLLAFLLGIEKPDQVARDPLVGQLFENLIVIECLKTRANQGRRPNLYFFATAMATKWTFYLRVAGSWLL